MAWSRPWCAVLLVLVPVAKSQAEDPKPFDWPFWRGSVLQSGVAAGPLTDKLVERWKFTSKNPIDSTPAIVGDTVLIPSRDEFIYALRLADGKERWKYKGGPFNAPPSVVDGLIYVGDADGRFHCMELATGKARWTRDVEQPVTSAANLSADGIFFGTQETLHCLSRDGKPRWTFKISGGPVLGSPAVVGDRVFASGCDKVLHILDVKTGKEIAAIPLDSQAAGAVAVDGDHLYLGTMNGEALGINWKKREVLWRYKAGDAFYSSTCLTPNLIVLGSRDKFVHAIDRKTGKKAWTFATRSKIDSSPVVAGSHVHIATLDGILFILDLDKGTEIKQLKLDSAAFGSPAVGNGALVIGTLRGVAHCFAEK
jgi:outer membrane protein assembly factor BamB